MPYRFQLREPFSEGVRRVALEQIEMAATKLASKDDVASAIHDARRCLKRLRALLRLIRPGLGERTYRAESERLVQIGRLLAGARDRHVMLQTLDKLQARFGADATTGGLRKLLADGRAGSRGAGVEDGRRQALAQLHEAKRLFTGKNTEGIAFEHALDGLEIVYRKARKAFHHAYKRSSDEAFHAWRKRVQQHWRHMALLSRGWPEAMSARAGEARELSRLLGEDHDLAVLVAFASKKARKGLEPKEAAALTTLCRKCQAELRGEARPRGDRLFAEHADDLRGRVALYWTSASSLASLAPADERAGDEGAVARMARKRTSRAPAKRSRPSRKR